jgi:6-pyruvoyltetrahydropterin/6-carboxytetrahydropterin synthase
MLVYNILKDNYLIMKYLVSKVFTFEAAHRLIKNYTGKCTNNHGHSWVVRVELEADELDQKNMVIDFNEIKRLKVWIDETLDHTTILWREDPMCSFIQQSGQRLFITDDNPTSETIATIIFKKAQDLFENDKIKINLVEVSETCTSRATCKR